MSDSNPWTALANNSSPGDVILGVLIVIIGGLSIAALVLAIQDHCRLARLDIATVAATRELEAMEAAAAAAATNTVISA
jgi:hypothetical protein